MTATTRRQLKNGGVYSITNKVNGKVYIGSAVDFKKRWGAHKRCLKKGVHPNSYLQKAWNKHGSVSFIFAVLEYELDPKKLLEIEQRWMDLYQAHNRHLGYNITPEAGSTAQMWADPERRRIQSEKAKKRWEDPEYRERVMGKQKAYWTIERRLSQSQAVRGQFLKNAELQAKFKESTRQLQEDPEFRGKVAEKKKATWNEPGKKEARSALVKALWQDPEYRERMLESRRLAAEKLKAENPEALEKAKENRVAALRRPEVREAIADSVRKLWEDPEYRERISSKTRGVKQGKRVQTPPCPRCFSEDTCSRGKYGDRMKLKCNSCNRSSICDPLNQPEAAPFDAASGNDGQSIDSIATNNR